jgi:predicted permease
VESIAIGALPADGSRQLPYELAGAPTVDPQRRPALSAVTIGPGYFSTLGAAVLSGRDFSDADRGSGVRVAIVNERFATRHWPGENPLGKRLRLFAGQTPGGWLTVVGVASNIAQNDPLRAELNALVYLPYRQSPRRSVWVLARSRATLETLAAAFRREVHAVDPTLPIQLGPFLLSERLAVRYQYKGVTGALFLICAAMALVLASIGLYAVVAHSVSERTQEIGIRTAMGATARDVFALIFRQGMLPVAIGLAIGLGAALAVTPILKSQLVQVSPADPLTLVAASATLIVAATLGCLIPARRATRVDPLVALRHE